MVGTDRASKIITELKRKYPNEFEDFGASQSIIVDFLLKEAVKMAVRKVEFSQN